MILNRTYITELRNWSCKLPITKQTARAVATLADMLSHRLLFDGAVKQFGRAMVGYCIAETIGTDAGAYDIAQREWAMDVLQIVGHMPSCIRQASIIRLHPLILAEASQRLRYFTMTAPGEIPDCSQLQEGRG